MVRVKNRYILFKCSFTDLLPIDVGPPRYSVNGLRVALQHGDVTLEELERRGTKRQRSDSGDGGVNGGGDNDIEDKGGAEEEGGGGVSKRGGAVEERGENKSEPVPASSKRTGKAGERKSRLRDDGGELNSSDSKAGSQNQNPRISASDIYHAILDSAKHLFGEIGLASISAVLQVRSYDVDSCLAVCKVSRDLCSKLMAATSLVKKIRDHRCTIITMEVAGSERTFKVKHEKAADKSNKRVKIKK